MVGKTIAKPFVNKSTIAGVAIVLVSHAIAVTYFFPSLRNRHQYSKNCQSMPTTISQAKRHLSKKKEVIFSTVIVLSLQLVFDVRCSQLQLLSSFFAMVFHHSQRSVSNVPLVYPKCNLNKFTLFGKADERQRLRQFRCGQNSCMR